ncbi:MAG: hypothetical protein H0W06_08260, partial [Chloroflexia bacterium]|nr:hypothetical protein [Chloroflexia bacterium]
AAVPTGLVEVWLNGEPQSALSERWGLGSAPMASMQLGGGARGAPIDIAFDGVYVDVTPITLDPRFEPVIVETPIPQEEVSTKAPIANSTDSSTAASDPAPTDSLAPADTPPDSPPIEVSRDLGTGTFGTVTNTDGEGVRCRTAPGIGAPILTVLPEGSEVELAGVAKGNWQPVICLAQLGYVMRDYLTIAGEARAAEPTATATEEMSPTATASEPSISEQSNAGGGDEVANRREASDAEVEALTVAVATPAPGGLSGEYFDNQDLTSLKLTRIDPTIDFSWGSGAPDPAIAADSFSIRWTGLVRAEQSETYTFFTTSNDGVRLWVNDQRLINHWYNHSTTEHSGQIALQAGQWYPIRLEYYEGSGSATIRLAYASPSTTKQVIPADHLSSDGASPTTPTPTTTATPTATAETTPTATSTPPSGAGPDQVHLAWVADTSTTLTVVWRTASTATPSEVDYRPAGAAQWGRVTGTLRPSGTDRDLA